MPVRLCKEFRFEAAHYLPMMPEGHKCRRLHGHSFKIEVHVVGNADEKTGILIDYGDIKKVVKPLIDQLDHYLINEVGDRLNEKLLQNPTSENMAKWFYEKLKEKLDGLIVLLCMKHALHGVNIDLSRSLISYSRILRL